MFRWDRQIDILINFINSIHHKRKFTDKLVHGNKNYFLDLTITQEDNSHDFPVFQKPSHLDTLTL